MADGFNDAVLNWPRALITTDTRPSMDGVIRNSIITCPHCGFAQREEMPVDACQLFMTARNAARGCAPKKATAACSARSARSPARRSSRAGRFTDEHAQSAQRHWKVPKIE